MLVGDSFVKPVCGAGFTFSPLIMKRRDGRQLSGGVYGYTGWKGVWCGGGLAMC
jgi:hypothetical protein